MLRWSVLENATTEELTVLSEGVNQFGRASAIGGHPQPIACLVREGTAIVAGGSGRTEFSRLFVSNLWVVEPSRGKGLGSEVLARLESAAHARGCTDAIVETLHDQVAKLYARVGYETLVTIPRYVGPFTRHVLLKSLVIGVAQSGV